MVITQYYDKIFKKNLLVPGKCREDLARKYVDEHAAQYKISPSFQSFKSQFRQWGNHSLRNTVTGFAEAALIE